MQRAEQKYTFIIYILYTNPRKKVFLVFISFFFLRLKTPLMDVFAVLPSSSPARPTHNASRAFALTLPALPAPPPLPRSSSAPPLPRSSAAPPLLHASSAPPRPVIQSILYNHYS